jgi:excisionase family DNA binding protein
VISGRSPEGAGHALLTVEQAAERMCTKPRFIRRLIAERRIPYVKLGAHVRIDVRDIDDFIAAAG